MRANIKRWTTWGYVLFFGYGTHACLERNRENNPQPGGAGSGGSTAGGGGSTNTQSGNSPGGTGGSDGLGGQGGGDGEGVACGDVTCATEATCVATPTPHCECAQGYSDPKQDGSLCQDIDECAVDNGGCDPLSPCTNSPGTFACGDCPAGYTAEQGECVDVDECAVDKGGCDPLTTCTNTAGDHVCGSCPHGYTGDGTSGCVDVDECAAKTHGCDPSVMCKNTPGSFTCGDCPPGYNGGGASGCTDIDECKTNNGGCDPLTKCTNTAGSFACGACPAGYSGTGAGGCVDINECGVNNGGCDTNATCMNTPGSRLCACKAGYSGNGVTCGDVNECATNNGGCDANATCTNTQGGRTCACKADYSGNGVSCSCALANPKCVNATTQKSCVNGVVTQKTCTGNQAVCIEGQGCLSCSGLRCDSTCCPAPPSNATAICTGTNACGVKCNTNYHGCNGNTSACYSNTDKDHCGNSCAVCNKPNATNVCSSGACDYTCTTLLGCLYPDGKPVCGSWGFESGLEGFAINVNTTNASDGTFTTGTKPALSTSRVLVAGYSGSGTSDGIDINIPLCPSGQGLDLSQRVVSVDIYPEAASGAPSYGNQNHSWIAAKGADGSSRVGCDSTISEMVPGKTYKWSCVGDTWGESYPVVGLTLHLSTGAAWKGTFYIDNFKVQ